MLSHIRSFGFAVVALAIFAGPTIANNVNNGGANNGGANNGGANNNVNNNGGIGQQAAGVEIDPQGVLRVMYADPQVTMQRLQQARQSLPPNLSRPSRLRKVSLTRLEKAVAERVAAGERPSMDMVAMAGLTRLEYVFFYPETGDIVIAGPAEGFGQDALGRIVGIETARPCILLDDVIIALRAYGPNGDKTNTIGVSIDPTQEGLANMQKTLKQMGGSFSGPQDVPVIVNLLRQSLGLNEVTITGIPAGTHFAHVLTEADYRMKLIGLNMEVVPVPLTTYVDRLTASMTSSNALIRWYFVPDYEAVSVSEDGNAFRMVGQGVKLVGADELVNSDGTRKQAGGRANSASRAFTTDFTKKFSMIADRSPVYSQLRNLVDLTIAAAFIQDRDLYAKAAWDLGIFADEDKLPVVVFNAPRQVETAVTAILKGNRLITPIGGGVTIQAKNALAAENVGSDKDGSIAEAHDGIKLEGLAAGQWWWD